MWGVLVYRRHCYEAVLSTLVLGRLLLVLTVSSLQLTKWGICKYSWYDTITYCDRSILSSYVSGTECTVGICWSIVNLGSPWCIYMIVKLNWDFKIARLFILVWGLIMTESRRQAVVLLHPDSSWVTQETIHLNSVASQSVRFAASKISSEWTDLHAWCKDRAKKVFSSRPLSRGSTWHYTNNAGDSQEDLLVKYAQSTFNTNKI